jgi:predicted outer membrane protein
MHADTQLRARVGTPLLAVFAALALAVGCDDDDDPRRDGGGETRLDSGRTLGDSSVGALTEAEIAGVVNAINASEIAFARSVEARLVDDDVAELAADVIAGHTASAADHADLIEALGITPVESSLSTAITRDVETMIEDFSTLTGAELDERYLDAQIILDAELLDDVQVFLIPSATTTRYREYIFELRDLLFANLQAGRELDGPPTGGTP